MRHLPNLGIFPNNLPVSLTSLIGREHEIKAIHALLCAETCACSPSPAPVASAKRASRSRSPLSYSLILPTASPSFRSPPSATPPWLSPPSPKPSISKRRQRGPCSYCLKPLSVRNTCCSCSTTSSRSLQPPRI